MPYKALFFTQAVLIAIIGIVHIAALQWYLYWHFIWLDVPVHFLGGIWSALIAAWILARKNYPVRARTVFSVVVLLGVAWEIFELAAGVPIEENFALDTSIDFMMDFLGGICGFLLARLMLQSTANGSSQDNSS